jgi:cytoskeletal protein CcmA (bactofilin family)
MIKSRKRGSSLAATLLWTSLVVCLGFCLAGLSVQHLSAMTYQSNRQQAQELARSVVSLAISRVMKTPTFGTTPAAPAQATDLLKVKFDGDPEGTVGLLSFNTAAASGKNIACSTNNLTGQKGVPGALGLTVPRTSMLLIGEGRSGGVVQHVQAIVTVPFWPYALAGAGTISAVQGFKIGALSILPLNGATPDESALKPSSLLSNSPEAKSIYLEQDTLITGDVRSAGGVVTSGNVSVQGSTEPDQAPVTLPVIPLSTFDPQAQNLPFTALPVDTSGNPQRTISGANRFSGNMVQSGSLKLSSAMLYVDGDLEVQGRLIGTGIVTASGNITLHRCGLEAGDRVSLLSGANITLTGDPLTTENWVGLVYSYGVFSAKELTILGEVIAAGTKPSGNAVSLAHVKVFQEPPPPDGSAALPTPINGLQPFPMGYLDSQAKKPVLVSVSVANNVYTITASNLPDKNAKNPTVSVNLSAADWNLLQNCVNVPPSIALLFEGRGYESPSTLLQLSICTTLFAQANNPANWPGSGSPIDPSSFLPLQDKVRVVMWRESD